MQGSTYRDREGERQGGSEKVRENVAMSEWILKWRSEFEHVCARGRGGRRTMQTDTLEY
jgi:hypothetical protein